AAGGVLTMRGPQSFVGFPDPLVAVRAAMDFAMNQGMPVGAHYAAFNPSADALDRLDMARLIFSAAPPGRVLVSRALALTLALRGPEFDCESFADIATPHGDISLNIVAPRSRPEAG